MRQDNDASTGVHGSFAALSPSTSQRKGAVTRQDKDRRISSRDGIDFSIPTASWTARCDRKGNAFNIYVEIVQVWSRRRHNETLHFYDKTGIYDNLPATSQYAVLPKPVNDCTLVPTDSAARQAPPFRAGKDSADGVAAFAFASQRGVCCCSMDWRMYWRTMEIGAPPQRETSAGSQGTRTRVSQQRELQHHGIPCRRQVVADPGLTVCSCQGKIWQCLDLILPTRCWEEPAAL